MLTQPIPLSAPQVDLRPETQEARGTRLGKGSRVQFGQDQSEEDALGRKLRLGHMLSEDEVHELTRRAAREKEDGVEDALERKLRLGHMLSEDEVFELTRRAAREEEDGAEDALERKLRLGHMLSQDEVFELKSRAAGD